MRCWWMHETEGRKKLICSLLVFIFPSSDVRVIAPLLLDVTEQSLPLCRRWGNSCFPFWHRWISNPLSGSIRSLNASRVSNSPHPQKLQMWGCTPQLEVEKIESAWIQNYIKSQGRNEGRTSSTNKQRTTGCYPDTDSQVERSGKSSTLSHTHCSSQWFLQQCCPQ